MSSYTKKKVSEKFSFLLFCFTFYIAFVIVHSLSISFCYLVIEENDDHSRIEALHKRRNFLASYCKLIVYSIMPTSCAADVFKHYVKVHTCNYDEIRLKKSYFMLKIKLYGKTLRRNNTL